MTFGKPRGLPLNPQKVKHFLQGGLLATKQRSPKKSPQKIDRTCPAASAAGGGGVAFVERLFVGFHRAGAALPLHFRRGSLFWSSCARCRRFFFTRSPSGALCHSFFGWGGSPTKMHCRRKDTPILTSLLEDLV